MNNSIRVLFLSTALFAIGTNAATFPSPTDFTTNHTITLRWQYPTNELSTNLVFVVWMTTDLQQTTNTSWLALTNVPGTVTSCKLSVLPGQMFFRLTASNFWGLYSEPSNTAETPPTPKSSGKSTIHKEP